MESMVLAAGKGSRLGEMTKTTPKCLVEICGKPILEWNLLKLQKAGALSVVVNTYHLFEQVEGYLESLNLPGLTIRISRESDLLNTGGGLKYAEPLFQKSGPIVVMNADILCSVELPLLLDFHTTHSNLASLVTRGPEESRTLLFERETNHLLGWQNSATGEQRLIRAHGHPISRGFCGIQVVSPHIFEHLGQPNDKLSIIEGYIDAAEQGHPVAQFAADTAYWFDIGTPSQLERARRFFEETQSYPV